MIFDSHYESGELQAIVKTTIQYPIGGYIISRQRINLLLL